MKHFKTTLDDRATGEVTESTLALLCVPPMQCISQDGSARLPGFYPHVAFMQFYCEWRS